MQLEVGNVVEGKVTGITKFGAFVEMSDGKTGMVHISEVAATYVKEISDHLTQGQTVKVKILSVSPDGKVSLSIKKCLDPSEQQQAPPPRRPRESRPPQGRGWQPKKQMPAESLSFEDMLTRFKQTSDDKMSDLRRSTGDVRRARKGSAR